VRKLLDRPGLLVVGSSLIGLSSLLCTASLKSILQSCTGKQEHCSRFIQPGLRPQDRDGNPAFYDGFAITILATAVSAPRAVSSTRPC